jgi:RimJ/RimL family protein N-acetyltransferase
LSREDGAVLTARLEVRPPLESDRQRFVELFTDDAFMVFSAGVHNVVSASGAFDRMLECSREVSFAKQPLIERSTGTIVGYAGVDWFELDGQRWLEFGYRLVPEARGKGYATEASAALLGLAAKVFHGALLAIIHPSNHASINTVVKLGFEFWKSAPVAGEARDLYRRHIPQGQCAVTSHARSEARSDSANVV